MGTLATNKVCTYWARFKGKTYLLNQQTPISDQDRTLPLQNPNTIMQKSDESKEKYHLGYK